MDYWHHRR